MGRDVSDILKLCIAVVKRLFFSYKIMTFSNLEIFQVLSTG